MSDTIYDLHDRDRIALKLFKFNEYVRKNHPEIKLRFTIYKNAGEAPVYALKINGTEYYYYDYPAFSYDTISRLKTMTDDWIFREITTNPLPEW